MKTASSFFPTRAHLKSRELHQEYTYQVIKVKDLDNSVRKIQTQSTNIFRDTINPPRKAQVDSLLFRPVGGKQLFKKVEQTSKERINDNKTVSKRSYKTQKNITSNNGLRFKREPEDLPQLSPMKQIIENKQFHKSSSVMPEEFLKSHATYDPYISASKIRNSTISPKATKKQQIIQRPVTAMGKRHDKWTANQRKEYQDKSALLNEIDYKKPLVQLYGDRFFEYILRNRFEDDFKPKPYVYILSSDGKPQSKTISKLRHYRPDIKQKGMMFLRGRKLKPESESM